MPERLRVAAVAGAGKTTTCIQITKRLLKKMPAIRIAYIVFNDKARQEALARFPTSTSEAEKKKVYQVLLKKAKTFFWNA